MKKNMGVVDRVVRLLFVAILAGLYFGKVFTGALGIIMLILAIALLLTSITGVCPAYFPFGLSTRMKK